jgi:hypothetical protein
MVTTSVQNWGALPASALATIAANLFSFPPVVPRPTRSAQLAAAGQPAGQVGPLRLQRRRKHPAAAMRRVCKAWYAAAVLTALPKWRPLAQALEEPEALLQHIAESVAHLYVTVPAKELVGGSLAHVQERLEGQLREQWLALTTVRRHGPAWARMGPHGHAWSPNRRTHEGDHPLEAAAVRCVSFGCPATPRMKHAPLSLCLRR